MMLEFRTIFLLICKENWKGIASYGFVFSKIGIAGEKVSKSKKNSGMTANLKMQKSCYDL